MVTQYALRSIQLQEDQHGTLPNDATDQSDNLSVHLSGKYSLVVTNEVLQSMRDGNSIYVNWHGN